MRVQLALNVRDLDEGIAYYSKLFGATPHKRRPGYANFAIENPPLKLVLFENPAAGDRINHLGVELSSSAEVEGAAARLSEAGIAEEVQQGTTCCHATQDKVWSREPQGLRWEWYQITDDEPDAERRAQDPAVGGVCCAAPASGERGLAR